MLNLFKKVSVFIFIRFLVINVDSSGSYDSYSVAVSSIPMQDEQTCKKAKEVLAPKPVIKNTLGFVDSIRTTPYRDDRLFCIDAGVISINEY